MIKVFLWSTQGNHYKASSFETGFMKKEWTAEWVKSPFPMKKVKPGTGGQNPAEYFRKEFDARDGIK